MLIVTVTALPTNSLIGGFVFGASPGIPPTGNTADAASGSIYSLIRFSFFLYEGISRYCSCMCLTL